LNLINYYDSRQNTYRFDGENKGKDGRGGGERSRTYSKPIKYKQAQGSEMSYVDESFEYRRTIKLPPVERGGSFEYNSTRNSIKKKFLNKSNFFPLKTIENKFAFVAKSPKQPFGKAKSTVKYLIEGKRIPY
jgi:hypothetical protein